MMAQANWRGQLMLLGALCGAILLLFIRDAADMVVIWWTSSTFSHCLFVPFLIGWLVHARMEGLRQLEPAMWMPGLLWLAVGNLLWLVGDAGGIGLFRHAGLVVMLQGAVVAILGPNIARALAFPLFFALFMVPFGEEIVPPLQIVTAKLAMAMLSFAGVPAHIEGIFITTANGYFEVAEACSGAKFVIAMTAYGALVCNVCFRSWLRRGVFLVSALALSVLANGARAFATIYVAHKTSVEAAVGFDHVVYGWLFFGIVMAAIMLAAWPFFDSSPADQAFDPRGFTGAGGRGHNPSRFLGLALACTVAAPVWSTISAARAPELRVLALPNVPGWTRTTAPMAYPWKPRFSGADYFVQGRYRNARGQTVDLAIATFARQAEGRELVGYGQGAADPTSEWVWSSPAPGAGGGLGEQITAPGPVVRHVVSFYSVGGVIAASPGAVKLATLKARILARDQRAAAILISAENSEGTPADPAIASFLRSLSSPKDLADASVAIR